MRAAGQTCLPIMQTGCAGVFQKDMCSCGIPSVPDRSPGWPSRRRLWTASFSGRRIRSLWRGIWRYSAPIPIIFSGPHALRRTRRAGPAGQGTPRLRFPGAGGTHRPGPPRVALRPGAALPGMDGGPPYRSLRGALPRAGRQHRHVHRELSRPVPPLRARVPAALHPSAGRSGTGPAPRRIPEKRRVPRPHAPRLL